MVRSETKSTKKNKRDEMQSIKIYMNCATTVSTAHAAHEKKGKNSNEVETKECQNIHFSKGSRSL